MRRFDWFMKVPVLLALASTPASAVYIRVNTGTGFGVSGDVDFGSGNSAVNFLAPGYVTFPTSGSTDVRLGGFYDFTLTSASR